MTRKRPNEWAARVLLGDSLELLASFDDASIDAVVTDPPYGLEFMGKEWDTFRVDKRSARRAGGGAGTGFAEIEGGSRRRRAVDNSPMEMRAFQNWVSLWAAELLRVLKPGGHLLAFGGTRTYHRLACGLEDAGFEIRDSLHWIYGSGFPKSLDVSKAIDSKLGVERDVVGVQPKPGMAKSWDAAYSGLARSDVSVTAAAAEWDGWGTALKPAHEPVVLARKLLEKQTVAQNVIAHGTGGLNVMGCAVGTEPVLRAVERPKGPTGGSTSFGPSATKREEVPEGRWPSNVLLSHLRECKGSGTKHTEALCAPGCPVAELNEMSGESSSSMPLPIAPAHALGHAHGDSGIATVRGHDDAGGAARFFYVAKPRPRERIGGTLRNLHPTVKPIELMRYLVRLVTPPGGVVLDPFLGSGTTGCAAMAEGARFVGIERDPESYETALARISDWAFAHDRSRPSTSST